MQKQSSTGVGGAIIKYKQLFTFLLVVCTLNQVRGCLGVHQASWPSAVAELHIYT